MSEEPEFQILLNQEVPPPPEPSKRSTGRYDPLLKLAREAGGQFVALRARDEESATKLSSVGSRINRGKMKGIQEGEYEARVSVPDRTMWVKYNGPVAPPAEEVTEVVDLPVGPE